MGKGGGMSARTLVNGLLSVVFVTASVSGVLLLAHATGSSSPDRAAADRVADDSASSVARAASAFDDGGARSTERRILARWDRQRAAAYADGDVAALRALYTRGSRTGAGDASILRDYVDRGLRVQHLRMQVLAFRVLRRAPSRLVLSVTDRLVGAEAVRGNERTRLPTDRADRRRITMVREHGRWVVDEVD